MSIFSSRSHTINSDPNGTAADRLDELGQQDMPAGHRELPAPIRATISLGKAVEAFGGLGSAQEDQTSVDLKKAAREILQARFLTPDTSHPPMYRDHFYLATLTREHETKLMERCSSRAGSILPSDMTKEAITITGGDVPLSSLLLANFTRNAAAVSRGDAAMPLSPRGGYPDNTYSQRQVRDLQSRLGSVDSDAALSQLSLAYGRIAMSMLTRMEGQAESGKAVGTLLDQEKVPK